MPEKADISRTLLLPFMSIILLVAVYMTANVLLPLKASGKGSKESEDVQERQHLSDDAGDGEVIEMNINFSEKCIVIDSGHGGGRNADKSALDQLPEVVFIRDLYRNGMGVSVCIPGTVSHSFPGSIFVAACRRSDLYCRRCDLCIKTAGVQREAQSVWLP